MVEADPPMIPKFPISPFNRVFRTGVCFVIAGYVAGAFAASAGAPESAPVYATIDEAIARNDVEDVKRHLQRDAAAVRGKPDAKLSPLHQAILRRNAKMVLLLLDH